MKLVLRELYRAQAAPLWIDPAGVPNAQAREALRLLARAGDDGLDPLDYRPPEWGGDAWHFDVQLSGAVLRYLTDLHAGRVDPARAGWPLAPHAAPGDLPAALRHAVEREAVAGLPARLAPPLPTYRRLREALAHYRSLAARSPPALTVVASALPVRPGDRLPQRAALAARLAALGDLPQCPDRGASAWTCPSPSG